MALTYSKPAEIHQAIPLFELPDAHGKNWTLGDWADKTVLVVVFTCNHCPYAQAVRPQLIELWNQIIQEANSVQFVAINSNDETNHPEDSLASMADPKFAYPFPYLRDETQQTAKDIGAVCTPDIFVYDRNRHLQYRGRINDNWQAPQKATTHDLKDAIHAILRGERPGMEQQPSMGCSLKWKDA